MLIQSTGLTVAWITRTITFIRVQKTDLYTSGRWSMENLSLVWNILAQRLYTLLLLTLQTLGW